MLKNTRRKVVVCVPVCLQDENETQVPKRGISGSPSCQLKVNLVVRNRDFIFSYRGQSFYLNVLLR